MIALEPIKTHAAGKFQHFIILPLTRTHGSSYFLSGCVEYLGADSLIPCDI